MDSQYKVGVESVEIAAPVEVAFSYIASQHFACLTHAFRRSMMASDDAEPSAVLVALGQRSQQAAL